MGDHGDKPFSLNPLLFFPLIVHLRPTGDRHITGDSSILPAAPRRHTVSLPCPDSAESRVCAVRDFQGGAVGRNVPIERSQTCSGAESLTQIPEETQQHRHSHVNYYWFIIVLYCCITDLLHLPRSTRVEDTVDKYKNNYYPTNSLLVQSHA